VDGQAEDPLTADHLVGLLVAAWVLWAAHEIKRRG
jgi:hypothetical protein